MGIQPLCIVCQDEIGSGDFCPSCREQYANDESPWLQEARRLEFKRRRDEMVVHRHIDDLISEQPDKESNQDRLDAMQGAADVELTPGTWLHLREGFDPLVSPLDKMITEGLLSWAEAMIVFSHVELRYQVEYLDREGMAREISKAWGENIGVERVDWPPRNLEDREIDYYNGPGRENVLRHEGVHLRKVRHSSYRKLLAEAIEKIRAYRGKG